MSARSGLGGRARRDTVLRWAFLNLRKDAAPGIDGLKICADYEETLEGNLADLHERVHRGAYRVSVAHDMSGESVVLGWGRGCAGRKRYKVCARSYSGEFLIVSADVIQSAEGNTNGCVNASTRPAPRHRRPWSAFTSSARALLHHISLDVLRKPTPSAAVEVCC